MPAPYTPAEIIALTNAARQSHHLLPLHPNQLLMEAAQNKAAAMLTAQSWAHNTPTQTSWEFLDTVGYQYQVAGENLARNFTSAQNVINAWLESPSHRQNLLNPDYTQIGVAVATNSADSATSILVVQYLATPMTATNSQVNQFYPTDILDISSINKQTTTFSVFFFGLVFILLILTIFFRQKHNQQSKSKNPHPKYWRN